MGVDVGSKGLEASIWASSSNGPSRYTPRTGDWTCLSCRFSNFASRQACFQCSLPKEEALRSASRGSPGHRNGFKPHNPTPILGIPNTSSPSGNRIQTSHNTHSNMPVRWSESRRGPAHPSISPLDRFDCEKYGLATSRWAPRHTNGWQERADRPEVLTRIVSVSKPELNTKDDDPRRSSKSPDLGLPYKVQHFILNMIQRIIEEGCYDFASRWIQNILCEKNYTCSQEVELPEWRRLLPKYIPGKAINPTSTSNLEGVLANTGRIRNAAVHRHLCDNADLRKMAGHAQDLMFMFSDVTRQENFHQLRIELDEWDKLNSDDPQAARNRLESALQVINELPMNDMDWTPNAESLMEIGPEIISEPSMGVSQRSSIPHHFGDEMQLD
ncbi:uncharacterized protein BP5553_06530 [Venustampulla echinocandica]|uniref:RanBP2-type domain-containing protein n=1 Tax=Venustampulla echinocandica TaxID=2656787 RepID=A0A370TK73_9HELO|nr:uncharacterized protein BP5553_06530 [Venustampulla echinocandica]RDL35918.1 hypothetical protein BP5553_06530 [Venustampulla echinocandica]